MDIQKIKDLIDLLDKTCAGEIEIHEGDTSVRISKQSNIAPTVIHAPQHPAPKRPLHITNLRLRQKLLDIWCVRRWLVRFIFRLRLARNILWMWVRR